MIRNSLNYQQLQDMAKEIPEEAVHDDHVPINDGHGDGQGDRKTVYDYEVAGGAPDVFLRDYCCALNMWLTILCFRNKTKIS